MQNPMDFYSQIQDMVRNEARQVATEVYNDLGTQYDVPQVPAHTHNGVDSAQIPSTSVTQGNRYITGLFEDTSETVTFGGILNPTRIVFQGFAANNKVAPATKRALINGEINFGTCFETVDLEPPIVVVTSGPGVPFCQSCNSMYTDSTDLTKTRVLSTEGAGADATAFFILSKDDTGAVFASAQVLSYNKQAGLLKIQFVVASNVVIQGALLIT